MSVPAVVLRSVPGLASARAARRLNRRCGALLATTALVAVTAFAPGAARAQDATWLLNPTSGDFRNAANWNPPTVPTGTAFFGASNTTALTFSANAVFGGWTFNPGASTYTFTNNQALTFAGAGIIGGSPAITNTIVGFLNFTDNSTAGNASITDNGTLNFDLNSTAGSATITNNFALNFNNSGTAGSATITSNNSLFFNNRSTAGNATINNNDLMHFVDNSTAGNAAITNSSGALTDFSFSTGPAGDDKVTAGSIAGAGIFQLGVNELTVGGNNLSTDVSGVIVGTGSLIKVESAGRRLSPAAPLWAERPSTAARSRSAVEPSMSATPSPWDHRPGPRGRYSSARAGQNRPGRRRRLERDRSARHRGRRDADRFWRVYWRLAGLAGHGLRGRRGLRLDEHRAAFEVGGEGTSTLVIGNGGRVNSDGGGSVGLSAGSTGTVTVTGPGSIWNNSPGGGLNIGSFGTGTLTIANGGMVIDQYRPSPPTLAKAPARRAR